MAETVVAERKKERRRRKKKKEEKLMAGYGMYLKSPPSMICPFSKTIV
jgi:hypothetical protein